MNSSLLVSVVLPCYNSELYIAEAIESVLSQQYSHFELLIVDDGSKDKTGAIAKQYTVDKRVTYLWHENQGPSAARNKAFAKCSGENIALLDADDVWKPDKLSKQLELFEAFPTCGMVFTDHTTFDAIGLRDTQRNANHYTDIVGYRELLSRSNFIYPSTVMIRRSVLNACGNFDESLRSIEDYDLWLRIAQKFEIRGIREPLTKIRIHKSNLSGNIPVMLKYEREVVRKHRQDLSWPAYHRRIAKAYFLNADRFIHQERRMQALQLFVRGLIRYPFLPVDITVFIVKFVLGKNLTERVKRKFANTDSVFARWYRWLYAKY